MAEQGSEVSQDGGKTRWLVLLGKLAATLALTVISLSAVGIAWLDEPLPDGITDADADALAARMMASTGAEAWERTAAVTWTYADRYTHLWDRERHLVRVRRGTWEAQVDLARQVGVAFEDGVPLEGVAREEAVAEGYAAWANDSFWLQAANKAFDGGTTRSRVALPDGSEALLVVYASGGVTPGDAYLWHLDEAGRPVSWQMWVSIIPIGGLSATWGGWVQLPTGAWVSTLHEVGPLEIRVTDLDGAESLAELEPGLDPFAALVDNSGR